LLGSAGPRYDQGQLEVAVLRRREPTRAVNQARATEQPSSEPAYSVRRPLQIQFSSPADPGNWRMTGKINWPSPHQAYGIAPTCEWANDEGRRIWLPAQHKDLVVEFTDRAEGRWRELAMRSRKLLAGVVRRSRVSVSCIALCYLHLGADVGI
jgi:hypothetical protein